MQSALKYIVFLLFLHCGCAALSAKDILVSGCIYHDKNENGIKEKSEPGIKNIPVSDGKRIVLTNSKGIYSFKSSIGKSIFPVLPSEFSFPNKIQKVFNSNFKYLSNDLQTDDVMINFGLIRQKNESIFSFTAVGDIQVGDANELNFAARSIGVELAATTNSEFNILLGDLVNDNPPLLSVMNSFFSKFYSPTWTVYGNHDRLVIDSTTTDATYNEVFGSSVYSFNKGEVHFIVLNNIFPKGKKGYEGRFSDDQLEFVKNDLELVPANRLIIILQHIPLNYTRNKNELLNLLTNRQQVLMLSGHTHTTDRYFHNTKEGGVIHELGVGASCGNWWTGEKNGFGVPESLMQCGSLPNYYLIHINKNKYTFSYKGIGQDPSLQMGVWFDGNPKFENCDISTGDSVRVIANVFGGADSTRVYLKLNNTEVLEMTKINLVSPNVERLVNLNKDNVYPTSGSVRNPLRKRPSPHIWVVSLPKMSAGVHHLEISAKDRYGLNIRQIESFYIP